MTTSLSLLPGGGSPQLSQALLSPVDTQTTTAQGGSDFKALLDGIAEKADQLDPRPETPHIPIETKFGWTFASLDTPSEDAAPTEQAEEDNAPSSVDRPAQEILGGAPIAPQPAAPQELTDRAEAQTRERPLGSVDPSAVSINVAPPSPAPSPSPTSPTPAEQPAPPILPASTLARAPLRPAATPPSYAWRTASPPESLPSHPKSLTLSPPTASSTAQALTGLATESSASPNAAAPSKQPITAQTASPSTDRSAQVAHQDTPAPFVPAIQSQLQTKPTEPAPSTQSQRPDALPQSNPAPASFAPPSPTVSPAPPALYRTDTQILDSSQNDSETDAGDMAALIFEGQQTPVHAAARSPHTATSADLTPQPAASNALEVLGQLSPTSQQAGKVSDGQSLASLTPAFADAASPDAPSPPLKLHVNQIATHLPAFITQSLIAAPRDDSATRLAPAGVERAAAPLEQNRSEPLKVIHFQLEPASLGAITVRMRVSHSKVDIALEAESARTSNLLMDAREHLTAAIGEKGLTLDSFKVALAPPATAVSGQTGAGAGDRQAPYAGGGGYANDDRPEPQRQHHAPERGRQKHDEKTGSFGPGGVIL